MAKVAVSKLDERQRRLNAVVHRTVVLPRHEILLASWQHLENQPFAWEDRDR